MKDWIIPIIVALIAATPSSIIAFLALRQGKTTHLLVNSRLTELLDVTRKASKAEGIAEGKASKS